MAGDIRLKHRSLGFLALTFFLGILVGSVVGQALGLFVPEDSVAYDLLVRPVTFGIAPTTIRLVAFELTLGVQFAANLMSVIGIFLVAQLLRWIR